MLHALDIVINDALIEPEKCEKIRQEFMPMRNFAGQSFTRRSQNQPPILFIPKQPFGIEPLHHVGHARLRDFQSRGNINHSRVAFAIN